MMRAHKDLKEDVKRDWLYAEIFEQESMHILRDWLWRQQYRDSSADEDRKRSTDAVVELGGGGQKRIAARVRRESSTRGKRDFTIRASRRSGAMTEWEKAKKDPPHIHCYCWVDDATDDLTECVLIDFPRFILSDWAAAAKTEMRNRDGTTSFFWWPMSAIHQRGFVLFGIKYPGQPIEYRWNVTSRIIPGPQPQSTPCPSCGLAGHSRHVIQDGRGIRLDCVRCGGFIEFEVWNDRAKTEEIMG